MHGGQHQEVRVGAVGLCQQHIGRVDAEPGIRRPALGHRERAGEQADGLAGPQIDAPLALMNPLDSTLVPAAVPVAVQRQLAVAVAQQGRAARGSATSGRLAAAC